MSDYRIKSIEPYYKVIELLSDDSGLINIPILRIFKQNNTKLLETIWQIPSVKESDFNDAREILLEEASAFKDDETLDELLELIYQERGRSMTE